MPITFDPSTLRAAARRDVMAAVVKGTEMVRTEMINMIMAGPKTGTKYGSHTASAPGEAPASDTGYLVSTIKTVYDLETLTGKVTVGADYFPHLEFGTEKMEPRPSLRPALAKMQPEITRLIGEAINKALEDQGTLSRR